ncbi:YlaF family protein [Fredinandcohnia quinoae]|uniref:YlaF family protein n=1 Tax=Fredinandcohnia quinoae TaxID=2918902 RepID=A0AAW5DU88_9BACI|nr:YlaF family protein [Fredinandcohnia sp. SECRCQ15]MCH1623933.1 YlaF family protein [Fredinandcohnia sp. SECRCQ15]
MKKVNILMLFFAFATAFSIMLIGVAIAERSLLGIILSIIAVIIVAGLGFSSKKKMRERGRL